MNDRRNSRYKTVRSTHFGNVIHCHYPEYGGYHPLLSFFPGRPVTPSLPRDDFAVSRYQPTSLPRYTYLNSLYHGLDYDQHSCTTSTLVKKPTCPYNSFCPTYILFSSVPFPPCMALSCYHFCFYRFGSVSVLVSSGSTVGAHNFFLRFCTVGACRWQTSGS